MRVTVGPPRPVVPGPAVVPGIAIGEANNNLDVVDHDGRRYLAWRTAPTHFADEDARLHVVASDDGGVTWSHETTIAFGRDVREPRLFSWGERLLLYCFTLGVNPRRFEPDRIHVAERVDGRWGEPQPIDAPDRTVVWRVRVLGGRPVMSVYRGADTIYTSDPRPTTVELWTTDDGHAWRPLDPDHPVSHVGGTETEVVEAPGGGWIAVTRKEGPFGGWGSDLCRSDEGRPDGWRVRSLPCKLDSPLMARVDDEVLLLARRHRAFGNRYDLGVRFLPPVAQTRLYQGVYWLVPKRTAVYRVDPDALTVEPLADLPSKGDTAFCALGVDGPGRYTVYNYSSPLDRVDRPWILGQLTESRIYACDLTVNT